MKKGLVLLLLGGWSIGAFAADLHSLRQLCPAGDTLKLTESIEISGIVISDCASENMELNPNSDYSAVDRSVNKATAYLQASDATCGIRLRFAVPADNTLRRYESLTLDLQGCRLVHEAEPDRITILDVTADRIRSREAGTVANLPAKERSISALTDADLYTYVTIPNAEMVFKGGSFADICEAYAQYCPAIHDDPATKEPYYSVNGRMDGWASLLRDTEGNTLYMLVNTLCEWRRDGRGVPQGMGPVSGILVHTPMRRYGGDMGRYSLRPVDRRDIRLSRKKGPWKVLTGWELDGTQGQQLEFEVLGLQGGVWKNGKKGDRLVADMGKTTGFFWTDSDSFIHIGNDLNALEASTRGFVSNGSIVLKGPSVSWFDYSPEGNAVGAKSIFVECSTRKLKATDLAFSFSWMVGEADANLCWGYPAQWRVQCSIDGQPWINLKETATGQEVFMLRSSPWWDKSVDHVGYRKTGYDAGLGMQQRSFRLPPEAIGHDRIILRLTPATNRMFVLRG
ncbi:MAG: hypothetical protein IJU13_01310, partial [Bacteroidales bacterium]|nr:hypothetical protein [Bacteroidales bacterium]